MTLEHVRTRVLGNLRHVDESLAERVAAGLGVASLPAASPTAAAPQDLALSPTLRLIDKYPATLQGRAVGILVSDGADGATVRALRKACEAAGPP